MALDVFWKLFSSQLSYSYSLVWTYRISFYAETDGYSAKESRELILRFLELFPMTFFSLQKSFPQFLATWNTLNSYRHLLNSLKQFCKASCTCCTMTNVPPGRKLGQHRTQPICFLFLSDHDSVLPYIQCLKRGILHIFPIL